MATNTTLLICNRFEDVYSNLFKEDIHCVMFDSIEELREKIRYYLKNKNARQKIIDQAFQYTMTNHTWAHRANKINSILKEII